MSSFNEYARKLDEIARAAFKESKSAAARLERATAARKHHMDEVAAARAKAEYMEAEQAVRDVRRKMDEGEYRQQINATRKELAAAVDEAFKVKPEQIDGSALELLIFKYALHKAAARVFGLFAVFARFGLRKQHAALDLYKLGRQHHEILRHDHIVLLHGLDVLQILSCYLRDLYIIDTHAGMLYEVDQQVERPLEDVKFNLITHYLLFRV